jgi:hypothetical protein
MPLKPSDEVSAVRLSALCEREFLKELGARTKSAVHPQRLAAWLTYKINSVLSSTELAAVEEFALRCRNNAWG